MTNRNETRSTRYMTGWLLSALMGLLFMAGCVQNPVTPRIEQSVPQVTPVAAEFVGNEVCKDCHASEFKQHQSSRHMATLHVMDRKSLGDLAPPDGHVPGTDIVLKEKNGQYFLTIPGEPITVLGEATESLPLQFAFGSGKAGMTYAALSSEGVMLEMRKSYFPHHHSWYLTPGHETQPAYSIGVLYAREQARHCMLCHATVLYADNSGPEPQFRGVGCEACHGAASTHVAAMRAGKTSELHLNKLTGATATQGIEVCARCHRSGDANSSQGQPTSMTNRFQPYGLLQSRCYRESGDTLSCVTCHDPHRDAEPHAKTYEAACLKCHSAVKTEATLQIGHGKPCPVNPKEKCINCHMPTRPVFKSSGLPISMADHYIRIYPEKRTVR